MLPDLSKEIAWWQDQMKPTDPEFGVGISDWTITSEYVDNLSTPEHGPIWGVTCSPTLLPEIAWLTPEDIAAKRVHLMFRTPTTQAEVAELHETIPHELVHVLDARKEGDISDMENTAHSLAPLLAKLRTTDVSRAASLARAIATPARARAYRAGDGNMPDTDDDKDKEKKEPMAQEGGEIDANAVVEAVSNNDGLKALEILKKLLANAADAVMPTNEPVTEPTLEAPTMGMKSEEAYARAKKEAADARKEAVEAIIDANAHLTDGQKALVRKQSTPAAARELAASYPRPQATPEKPTMGMPGHPATGKGGGAPQTALARIKSGASARVQKIMGMTGPGNDGISYDLPGHMVYVDYVEMMAAQRARHQERTGA